MKITFIKLLLHHKLEAERAFTPISKSFSSILFHFLHGILCELGVNLVNIDVGIVSLISFLNFMHLGTV